MSLLDTSFNWKGLITVWQNAEQNPFRKWGPFGQYIVISFCGVLVLFGFYGLLFLSWGRLEHIDSVRNCISSPLSVVSRRHRRLFPDKDETLTSYHLWPFSDRTRSKLSSEVSLLHQGHSSTKVHFPYSRLYGKWTKAHWTWTYAKPEISIM